MSRAKVTAPVDEDIPVVFDDRPPREPDENWVGWMVRPFDGGWCVRRILMPRHAMDLFVTDQPSPANRREIVVAQIASEAGHPSLATRTEWGQPIGMSPDPQEPEMVEMLDSTFINQQGMRENRYRSVPKAAYDALPEVVKAQKPLRKP